MKKFLSNKSGFTLIEVLVVVTLLSLLVAIIYPIMTGVIRDSKEKVYRLQIKNIEKASQDWTHRYTSFLPNEEGESITIRLIDLKKAGLIRTDLKDARTKKPFPDDMLITITRVKKKYKIDIDEKSGTRKASRLRKNYIHTNSLILKGNYYEEVEINQNATYEDPGVVGYDDIGKEISSFDITRKIKKNGKDVSDVDMSSLGIYEITYETSIEGKKISIQRKVEVKDTTAPIIKVPLNTTLSKTEENFDILEGVSATDNSNEKVKITTSGDVTLHVPGVYVITYKATDASGNTREKKRSITISEDF